ncbi:MAG: hypothetical protein H6678_05270 [Candidatus Delongbacteria bacterium]|nr:hypothetical protein [Candidatus Delongbacteria bacterium]
MSRDTMMIHARRICLGLFCGLVLMACQDLPEDDPGVSAQVTLSALLEPGDTGIQAIHLSHPVRLGDPVDGPATFVSGASIRLTRGDGGSVLATEDTANSRYTIDRAQFELVPLDSITVELEGSWQGMAYSGTVSTRIVDDGSFEITSKPNDHSHGFDADTLMFHNLDAESNFTDPTAFLLNWTDLAGPVIYGYQFEYEAISPDGLGGFVKMPSDRLRWLRDDKELAWQWGPYPDVRSVPGPYVQRQRVSWGGFVFVDQQLEYPAAGSGRHMGYYRITVRRLSPELLDYFFSTHMWIRQFDFDPVSFNLVGDHCRGIVGSCVQRSFRVAIVEETGRSL